MREVEVNPEVARMDPPGESQDFGGTIKHAGADQAAAEQPKTRSGAMFQAAGLRDGGQGIAVAGPQLLPALRSARVRGQRRVPLQAPVRIVRGRHRAGCAGDGPVVERGDDRRFDGFRSCRECLLHFTRTLVVDVQADFAKSLFVLVVGGLRVSLDRVRAGLFEAAEKPAVDFGRGDGLLDFAGQALELRQGWAIGDEGQVDPCLVHRGAGRFPAIRSAGRRGCGAVAEPFQSRPALRSSGRGARAETEETSRRCRHRARRVRRSRLPGR